MATTQSLRVNAFSVNIDMIYRQTDDLGSKPRRMNLPWYLTLSNGTGANKANYSWWASYTIAASGTQNIDLRALTDEYGNAVAMNVLKALAVKLTASTDAAAKVKVGAAGSNAFSAIFNDPTDALVVKLNGFNVLGCDDSAGYTVDATHKNLLLTNLSSTQSITVVIAVLGEK